MKLRCTAQDINKLSGCHAMLGRLPDCAYPSQTTTSLGNVLAKQDVRQQLLMSWWTFLHQIWTFCDFQLCSHERLCVWAWCGIATFSAEKHLHVSQCTLPLYSNYLLRGKPFCAWSQHEPSHLKVTCHMEYLHQITTSYNFSTLIYKSVPNKQTHWKTNGRSDRQQYVMGVPIGRPLSMLQKVSSGWHE